MSFFSNWLSQIKKLSSFFYGGCVCVCVDEIEEDDFSGLKTPQRERERGKLSAGVCGWLVTYLSCHKLFCSLYWTEIRFNRFTFSFFRLSFFFWRWIETEPEHQKTAVELTLDETSFLQSVDGEKEASPACFDHLFRALSAPSFSFSPSPQPLIDLFPKFFYPVTVAWTPNDYHFMATRICIQLDTGHRSKRKTTELSLT